MLNTFLTYRYTIQSMLQSDAAISSAAPPVDRVEPARGRVARTARLLTAAARRFLVISAIAFWLGGFTFYSGVAIPMGVEVLGSHRAVGFITQRVTNWLNVAGVAALTIFLWNLSLGRRSRGKWLQRTMFLTWAVMALIEVELLIMHPFLDRMLVTHPTRQILNPDRFDVLHQVYLISTTVQWTLGMIHVCCICLVWGASELTGGAAGPA